MQKIKHISEIKDFKDWPRNTDGELKFCPVLSDITIDWEAHDKRCKPFIRKMEEAHKLSVKLNLGYRAQHQR